VATTRSAPETISPEERADYDKVMDRLARRPAGDVAPMARYFHALLNAPAPAAAISGLGQVLRTGSQQGYYEDWMRELIDMVLAVDCNNQMVFEHHLADAVAVGVPPQAILAICRGESAGLEVRSGSLCPTSQGGGRIGHGGRFLVDGGSPGSQGAVGYTACIGWLLMTMRLVQALGSDFPPADREEILRPYLAGTAALPEAARGVF